MAIDAATIPLSLATVSIGCKPSHTLPHKITAIAKAGFKGIELGMPDLVTFAGEYLHEPVGSTDYDSLVTVAKVVRAMCEANHLVVMLLQPFANFEGWRRGSAEHTDAWERVNGWIRIMQAVGCETLQVGSTDTEAQHPSWTGDRDLIVQDLKDLGTRLKDNSPPLRMAYENWCWSTHAPGWKEVWDIVHEIDLPNVGLCLDTFQSAGGEWADPTTESGLLGDRNKTELDADFSKSMKQLAKTIPSENIFLLQVSDAYRVSPPIPDRVDEQGLRPRGQWSAAYRPTPFTPGSYLPVVEMAKGVLGTGFRGWFSVEVFDQGPDGQGRDYELDDFARECAESTRELVRRCRSA